MSHFSISPGRLRSQAVILSMVVTILGFASDAAAVIYDFNVANGNYNVAANWINHADNTTGVPTDDDFALVRNGGTLNITAADGDATAYIIRVGAGPQTVPDVVFPDVDPPAPPAYGGTGTLNWTGGNIFGNPGAGPRLTVGQYDNTTGTHYTGIVNQSGGKISLNTTTSFLVVGASGNTPAPTSVYNLMPGGTIGVTSGSGNTNNGINVRNGTFNMTGGDIVSDDAVFDQRAITISSSSGTQGSENVAYANFSGGTVDVNGGMRVASTSHTKGYVTISGTANLHFRGVDIQLATNATNSYGQVDMSAGSLSVGDLLAGQNRRLIVGDSGTGVFNLSGGTVNLNNSFVVGNNASSKGTFYQTGGSLTVRSIETNRNSGTWDLSTENASIIIDGPSAVFTQQNTVVGTTIFTGQTTIGQFGKGRFEVRQGQANLREIRMGQNATSRATLAVTGGILRIQDGLTRNVVVNEVVLPGDFNSSGQVNAGDYVTWKKNQNTNNALPNDNGLGTPIGTAHYDLWRANFGNFLNNNTPTIILTGGELELTPALPATAISWQASMKLEGTDFDPRPGGILQTNVGSFPSKFADFSLRTGSVWDLDIASNSLLTGADWVDVPNSTTAANLNGGHLNVHLLGGYTPAPGDTVRIVRNAANGVTFAGLTVSNPSWQPILAAGGTELHLTYNPGGSGSSLAGAASAIPEPSTIVLVALFASVSLASRPARSRSGTGLCVWLTPKGRRGSQRLLSQVEDFGDREEWSASNVLSKGGNHTP